MIVNLKAKKGSLMIEISVAIFMILVCFFCYENSKKLLLITNEERLEKHNKQVALESLSKEIKYNVTYSWIKAKLSRETWNLEYNENFMEELENIDLEKLTIANEGKNKRIEIKAKTINDDYIEIGIKLFNDREIIEKNIIKYPWMDYA